VGRPLHDARLAIDARRLGAFPESSGYLATALFEVLHYRHDVELARQRRHVHHVEEAEFGVVGRREVERPLEGPVGRFAPVSRHQNPVVHTPLYDVD
jgi:hypothetical protein